MLLNEPIVTIFDVLVKYMFHILALLFFLFVWILNKRMTFSKSNPIVCAILRVFFIIYYFTDIISKILRVFFTIYCKLL